MVSYLEVDIAVLIHVECAEHVVAELLGVPRREEHFVHVDELGRRQPAVWTVLLQHTTMSFRLVAHGKPMQSTYTTAITTQSIYIYISQPRRLIGRHRVRYYTRSLGDARTPRCANRIRPKVCALASAIMLPRALVL